MSFIVSARVSTGEISYRRDSMIGALEQSLALLSSGMQDVAVTDPRGRRYEPSEFGRILSGVPSEGAEGSAGEIARAA